MGGLVITLKKKKIKLNLRHSSSKSTNENIGIVNCTTDRVSSVRI